jgi:AcrR family transcriptional regulator
MALLLTEAQVAEARARIVKVAEHQAVERGLEQVSMHSIARALGCSATALYRYFENKEAILAASRTAALDRLSVRLEAAFTGPGDIWAISRDIGRAYVEFAFENQDAYRLIFDLAQPDGAQYPALAAAMARSRGNMTRYVERLVEEGGLDADPVILGHVFWAGLHGLISLQMAGKLGPQAPSFEILRRDMMRRLVRGSKRLTGRRIEVSPGSKQAVAF